MLRQHQDEGNLAELRRLEPEKAQVEPALGSLHRHPEHHDPEKKDKGKGIDAVGPGEKSCIPDLEHREKGGRGEAAPQELPGGEPAPPSVETRRPR
jgi:hypothetical protein